MEKFISQETLLQREISNTRDVSQVLTYLGNLAANSEGFLKEPCLPSTQSSPLTDTTRFLVSHNLLYPSPLPKITSSKCLPAATSLFHGVLIKESNQDSVAKV